MTLQVRNKSDKEVLKAFLNHESAEGIKLSTDGQTLDGLWMGGKSIAQWIKGKIKVNDLGSKSAQIVQRALSKRAPDLMLANEPQEPQTIAVDKEELREIIREAVQKKLALAKEGKGKDGRKWQDRAQAYGKPQRTAGSDKVKKDAKKEVEDAKRRLKEALAILEGYGVTESGSTLGKGRDAQMQDEAMGGGVPGAMGSKPAAGV